MKTAIQRFLVILLMTAIMSSCTNELIYNNIQQLNYGTSFGQCIGYCKQNVAIKSTKATFTCSSWNSTLPTLTKTDTISSSALDSISSLNTETFFKIAEITGCPDCADGGAEWLEIILTNGKKHKVTFEYYHESDSIKEQIKILRKILNKNACN